LKFTAKPNPEGRMKRTMAFSFVGAAKDAAGFM
jgi:hypothetical protein